MRSAVTDQTLQQLRGPSQRGGPSPPRIAKAVSGLCNLRTKNRQPHRCTAVVSTVAATAAGTTALLVVAPRTCRRSRALLRGRASKSGQTRPHREIARAPGQRRARRSACSQEAQCHRVPAFAFARAACNLLPPRVTTSSTFFFYPDDFITSYYADILKLATPDVLVRSKN